MTKHQSLLSFALARMPDDVPEPRMIALRAMTEMQLVIMLDMVDAAISHPSNGEHMNRALVCCVCGSIPADDTAVAGFQVRIIPAHVQPPTDSQDAPTLQDSSIEIRCPKHAVASATPPPVPFHHQARTDKRKQRK